MKKNDPSPSQRSPQSCRTKQFAQILHRLIGNRQRFEGQIFHVALRSLHIMAIKWFIDLNCFKLLCRTPTRRPRIYSISASNPGSSVPWSKRTTIHFCLYRVFTETMTVYYSWTVCISVTLSEVYKVTCPRSKHRRFPASYQGFLFFSTHFTGHRSHLKNVFAFTCSLGSHKCVLQKRADVLKTWRFMCRKSSAYNFKRLISVWNCY